MNAVALEDRVLLDLDEDVEITRRAATQTGLALAGKADAGAGFNACRDVHRKRAFLFGASGPAAGPAGVLDDLAHAGAGRAGAFDREEALLRPHLAHARTGRAGDGFGPTFGPRAPADVAGDRGGNVDGFLNAVIGVFQRDAQVVAQVRSALCPAASAARPAAPAHEIAEQVFEHVREGRGEIALTGPAARTPPAFEGGMTIAVIGSFLVGVFQRVIGFVDFLELCLGRRIVGIAVGVQLLGLAAVGLLQLFGRSGARHAKNFVEIAFCHGKPLWGTR